MAKAQTFIHFTNGLWVHQWNLMKYILLILFLITQSSCHNLAYVITTQLLWLVQNCDLIWSLLFIFKQYMNLQNLNCEDIECVQWILGSILLPWLSSSHSIKSWSKPPISLQTDLVYFVKQWHDVSYEEVKCHTVNILHIVVLKLIHWKRKF